MAAALFGSLVLFSGSCLPATRTRELNPSQLKQQLEQDGAALMAFRQWSVTADPNGFLRDWNTSSTSNPCSWRGIRCSTTNGQVATLDLGGAGLVGSLHLKYLLALPHLQHLNLSGNSFSDGIDSSTNSSAKSCGLEMLDLSFNNLSNPLGSPPSSDLITFSLSKCRNLKLLNLSNNKLTGDLWPNISVSAALSCQNLSTMDLSHNQFSGNIPSSLLSSLFSSLGYLDLSHNKFSGKFSDFEFGLCSKLTLLNLSSNCLSSMELPASLSNCELLRTLDLSYNKLGERIPGLLLLSLKNLRWLSLSHNQLQGEIPVELGQACGNLEQLDLSANKLTGGFPSTFASCLSLRNLNLGNNLLTGDFLDEVISRIQGIRYLYLPFNNINGSLPLSLSECTQLQVLDLSSNALTGTIPSGFCPSAAKFKLNSSSALEKLLLPNNALVGSVPSDLANCKNLKVVDLSVNNLTGPIPAEIWDLRNLSNLLLWGNRLTGEISKSICTNAQNLEKLILNNNFIEGPIPSSIGNCTSLKWLLLSNNKLSGEIPISIGSLPRLVVLILGSNMFTGQIPPKLVSNRSEVFVNRSRRTDGTQLALLTDEDGSLCKSTGGILAFEGIRQQTLSTLPIARSCQSVRFASYRFPKFMGLLYLDLSYNSLSGSIPEMLGSMNFLQVLNLRHNMLTGSIPKSIESLKLIQYIDLSHNSLQGLLPGSLGALSLLNYLDLSNNNLTGPIPSGGQITTFSPKRFTNNSGLCGLPLDPCGSTSCDRLPILSKDHECGAGMSQQNNSRNKSELDSVVLQWKAVAMGYGCGTVFGAIVGYCIFKKNGEWKMLKQFLLKT